MTSIKTRIRIEQDGSLTGRATGLPAREHDAEIILLENAGEAPSAAGELLARVRAIQAAVARLPVLDHRSPDEILGYNEHGHFD